MSLTRPTLAPLTRRRFLAAAGATALAARTGVSSSAASSAPHFSYTTGPGELRVYSTRTSLWTHIQSIASDAPVSLAVDSRTHTLHVLHKVAAYQGLPRGYIESFRIDHRTGRLDPLSRQPLSLSGIDPLHMAISPDGAMLAVAIHGGGAYNLLPLLEDGRPGRPIAIRKETGQSTDSTARPGYIAFSPDSGRIFAFDQGTGYLSMLAPEPGLPVLARFPLKLDSIPTHFALYPSANLLYPIASGDGSLRTLRLHPEKNELSEAAPPIDGNFRGPVEIHAPSKTLAVSSAGKLSVFTIDPVSGALFHAKQIRLPGRSHQIHTLVFQPSGKALLAATTLGILQFNVDSSSGLFGSATLVASTPARSISFMA